jgi:CHAT domain-containing protein
MHRAPVSSSARVGLLIAALVVVSATGGDRPGTRDPPELQELVTVIGARRPADVRVSGAFAYAPVEAATRSAGGRGSDSLDLTIAVAKIERRAAAEESATALDALGVAALMTRDFPSAVRVLEDAAIRFPGDGRIRADLSAAYIAHAQQLGALEQLPRALDAAEAALTRATGPAKLSALFNRAVALERLHLREQAGKAWDEYLSADPSSAWSAEARTRRAASRQPANDPGNAQAHTDDPASIAAFVRAAPQVARERFDLEVLPEWADAALKETPASADRALRRVQALGDALTRETGDREPAAVAAHLARLSAPSVARARAIDAARAHRLFADSRRWYEADQAARALPAFREAARGLRLTGSPAAIGATLYTALVPFRAGQSSDALDVIGKVRTAAVTNHYEDVAARAEWLKGLILASRTDLAASLTEYRAALNRFERLGQLGNAAYVRGALMAETYDLLNQPRQAWTERERAFREFSHVRSSRRRHVMLGSAVRAAMRGGLPRAARRFQDAEVEDAKQWSAPLAAAEVYLQRARIHAQSGDVAAALRDLSVARTTADGASEVIDTDIAIEEAVLHAETPRPVDVAALDRAIGMLQRRQLSFRLSDVFLLRARLQRRLGVQTAASADFEAAAAAFERARAAQPQEQLRIDFAARGAELYREAIDFESRERRRTDVAFAFAERGRARALLDALQGNSAGLAQMRARLPARAAVLYYVALNDRLLVWLITRDGERLAEIAVHTAELGARIAQLRVRINRGDNEIVLRPQLAELYELLVRPLASAIAGDATIVVVPDGPIHDLPFAALFDQRANRFVVDDHAVVVAPSLAVFIAASDRARRLPREAADALVVGSPDVDPRIEDVLPRLPGAEREAREIAALYGATPIVGPQATKARFLADAPARAVVHFAGHAVANVTQPRLSRLLFAPDPSDVSKSLLFGYELDGVRFERTRLVVLAACGTASGVITTSEGVLNMSRAFLAAGAPTVIATQWDIDDRSATELFVSLHRWMRAGHGPADALRRSMLEARHRADPRVGALRQWAGIVAIGGMNE